MGYFYVRCCSAVSELWRPFRHISKTKCQFIPDGDPRSFISLISPMQIYSILNMVEVWCLSLYDLLHLKNNIQVHGYTKKNTCSPEHSSKPLATEPGFKNRYLPHSFISFVYFCVFVLFCFVLILI